MPSSLAPLPHTTLFSPRCVPEPRPNTDPRANHPMYNTSSIPVKSNLNLYAWQSYLRDYPDPLLTQTLSNIIQFGANIGFCQIRPQGYGGGQGEPVPDSIGDSPISPDTPTRPILGTEEVIEVARGE